SGGVGMAAVHVARHLGADVFGTASPGKWDAVRGLGLPDGRIANSRTLDFRESFLAATGGRGMDVVLDALAREFVDASLDLLPRGGRFVEMGKTDIREPEQVAQDHPGVVYQSFDVMDAGPDKLADMFAVLTPLFKKGALPPLPVRSWDVREISDAFRYLQQARHTGKLVLRMPVEPDPRGTVLVTGASGALGTLLARHLAAQHGVRHLLLASRRGEQAPGAAELTREIAQLGAQVTWAACDVSDRKALADVLDAIPVDRPLTGVVHAAGVLDDGLLESLTPERLRGVLAPKAEAARHLDELTRTADLALFVLFSSAAGTFGNPGQANYAAANAYLDALAAQRRASGLPATSLAWGLWDLDKTSGMGAANGMGATNGMGAPSGMGGTLTDAERTRMAASGTAALTGEQGLALYDTALTLPEAALVPMHLDTAKVVKAMRPGEELDPLLRALVRTPARRTARAAGRSGEGRQLADRLAAMDARARNDYLLDLVRTAAAAVLGHAAGQSIAPTLSFKDLGFDSLTGVEFRNRLTTETGIRLPATLVFDYPTPDALAGFLHAELLPHADADADTEDGADAEGESGSAGERAGAQPTVGAPSARTGHGGTEPIAIVSIGCRFPGGVRSPEDLWRLLADGRDAMGPMPTDRGWDVAGLYDPTGERPGTTLTDQGGFLDDAGVFDAPFFGISPREALAMDPQQRLLLETSWEALERAGIDPHTLAGSSTGVFAGLIYHDYGNGSGYTGLPDGVEGFLGTGTSGGVASGRIAYTLGLEGPAVTVDTACSSSLVALHMAVQALQRGECDLALAGGVTVMASPDTFVDFSRQGGLAVDGRCKAFADGADGTGWAEGVGMVLVERLSDARRNGHDVLAVVRGSALNQDGASNGLTAPNGPSQQRVVRQALTAAGLTAADVDVVEAHGTGTRLGDPIEAQALLATYGQARTADEPLWLGSVKSNLGHTQAAAGIAGVIKMVAAFAHEELPATLHADEPNSRIDWESGAVRLLTEARAWPRRDGSARRAGVSAFGFSGTNAHVILEEPPAVTADATADHAGTDTASASSVTASASSSATPDTGNGGSSNGGSSNRVSGNGSSRNDSDTPVPPFTPTAGAPVPWLITGRTERALRAQARRLHDHLAGSPADVSSVGHALATTRTPFEHRAVLVGGDGDGDGLLRGLRALADGEPDPAVEQGLAPGGQAKAVFVFPGQGAQWVGMAAELLDSSPVFRARMEDCAAAVDAYTDFSLLDVLRGADGAPSLDRVDVVQPALWAVMVSLAALWESLGVVPSAVVGHSQGEIAAACVAGALGIEDAARVVVLRSRALVGLAGTGGMVSVALPADELAELLGAWPERISVAALNGPSATVVAGDPEALDELLATCERGDIRARRVDVDYASHSAHMEPLREELTDLLAPVRPRAGRIPLYSTLEDRLIDGHEMDADYWYRNIRSTVRFAPAVRALAASGHTAFVECSPHPVVTAGLQATLDAAADDGVDAAAGAVVTGTLRRDEGGAARVLTSLGRLVAHGVRPDWAAVFAGRPQERVALPTYAFQGEHYWLKETVGGDADPAAVGQAAAGHPLLGAAVALPDRDGLLLTGRLSLDAQPWLGDHLVGGTAVVPGTALLELALHAADEAGCAGVGDFTLQAPLVLGEHTAVQLRVLADAPGDDGRRPVTLYSRPADAEPGDTWTPHATGLLQPVAPSADRTPGDRTPTADGLTTPWPPASAEALATDSLYEEYAAIGVDYGPVFRGLRAAWRRDGEIFAEVSLEPEQAAAAAGYAVHPALLDAALHAVKLGDFVGGDVVGADVEGADVVGGDESADGPAPSGPWLPFGWTDVTVHRVGAPALRVHIAAAGTDAVSVTVADASGTPVATVGSLQLRQLEADALARLGDAGDDPHRDTLFRVMWERVETPEAMSREAESRQGAELPGDWAVFGDDPLFPGLPEIFSLDELDGGGTAGIGSAGISSADIGSAGIGSAGIGSARIGTVLAPAAWQGGVTDTVTQTLGDLQMWLADPRTDDVRLVVVTRGALSTAPDEDIADLAQAAVHGLVRSVQAEHPGRVVLADIGTGVPSQSLLARALATDEPEFALRSGEVLVPRLARTEPAKVTESVEVTESAKVTESAEVAEPTANTEPNGGTRETGETASLPDLPDLPDLPTGPATGTVLVTGGTGGLGALTARHLADRHGVRDLLLVSRRGPAAPGATELVADLEAAGAAVTVVACDLTDRDAVAKLLADHPVRSVFHAAGVLDDATLRRLTPDKLSAVLAPKAVAARHLHELTAGQALDRFVLFSSSAGVFGNAGQANYAAANAYLDALAAHRRASGLPATSLAWGLWSGPSGMTGHLDAADLARLARSGVRPLTPELGLELLDAALAGRGAEQSLLVPLDLDTPALRASAASEGAPVPHLLRTLVRARTVHRAAGPAAAPAGTDGGGQGAALRARLAELPAAEREAALLDVVQSYAATVLGFGGTAEIGATRPFKELGFDSLMAVEFRNRLGAATGVRLAATTVFDYPTPRELARLLLGELAPEQTAPAGAADELLAELDRIEGQWSRARLDARLDDVDSAGLAARLEDLLARVRSHRGTGADGGDGTSAAKDAKGAKASKDTAGVMDVNEQLQDASTDEVLAFITDELGIGENNG
ncbi:SDR family NAD(P)-dependent oxidoreductase, partial [Streptomyces sp. NPDC093510]|uniref:SDR family NAD(P)-dependent oxidoreductase n=1 Tax=Streptomyces sp. NPDC093510 TaxID=3155199 RepID=UPI00341BD0C3